MPYSLYQSCIPVFQRSLTAFSAIIDKAAAHAEAAKFDPAIYVTMRLRPDMFSFARQVQTFCDNAKNASARLAGVEPPRFEDNEATLDELKRGSSARSTCSPSVDRRRSTPAPSARSSSRRPEQDEDAGRRLSPALRLPNFYFHLDDRLRHPALRRRRDRQARLSRRGSRLRWPEHSPAKGHTHEHSSESAPARACRRRSFTATRSISPARSPPRRRADVAEQTTEILAAIDSCWPRREPTRRGSCRRPSISPTSRLSPR